jgi:hypothetical protein
VRIATPMIPPRLAVISAVNSTVRGLPARAMA